MVRKPEDPVLKTEGAEIEKEQEIESDEVKLLKNAFDDLNTALAELEAATKASDQRKANKLTVKDAIREMSPHFASAANHVKSAIKFLISSQEDEDKIAQLAADVRAISRLRNNPALTSVENSAITSAGRHNSKIETSKTQLERVETSLESVKELTVVGLEQHYGNLALITRTATEIITNEAGLINNHIKDILTLFKYLNKYKPKKRGIFSWLRRK